MPITPEDPDEAPSQQSHEVGFIELLIDLVLVFALTRVSEYFVNNLDWVGFWLTLVLLSALALIWIRATFTANRYGPSRPAIETLMISTMLGVLLMALAIPDALGERGMVFAAVYVAVQLIRLLWLLSLRGDRYSQRRNARVLFWTALAGVLWLAGIFTTGVARLAWWTVAIGLEYVVSILDHPAPRLGRDDQRYGMLGGKHLGERYRAVLTIALGETILATGIELSPHGFAPDRTAALIVAFAGTILMGLLYIHRAGELLPAAITTFGAGSFRVGRLAAYAHLVMVVGIVISAVGDHLIIKQPFGRTKPAWVLVILGGPALFLFGRVMLEYSTFARISWFRPAAILLLAALIPIALRLPPILVSALAAVVLAALALYNFARWRRFARELTPPGLVDGWR